MQEFECVIFSTFINWLQTRPKLPIIIIIRFHKNSNKDRFSSNFSSSIQKHQLFSSVQIHQSACSAVQRTISIRREHYRDSLDTFIEQVILKTQFIHIVYEANFIIVIFTNRFRLTYIIQIFTISTRCENEDFIVGDVCVVLKCNNNFCLW